MTDDVSAEFLALVRHGVALALATVDARGLPVASHVPFAVTGGAIVFSASGLSAHGKSLAARPEASLLIVGEPTDDPYARSRVTLDGRARRCEFGAAADACWEALERRHGATVAILRTLADFTVYACEPVRARLVLGFASAHDVDADEVRDLLKCLDRR